MGTLDPTRQGTVGIQPVIGLHAKEFEAVELSDAGDKSGERLVEVRAHALHPPIADIGRSGC